MARNVQCKVCGAVLLPQDEFCGECGTPRPEAASPVPPDEQPPAAAPAPSSWPEMLPGPEEVATAKPSFSARTGWRVAFLVLTAVGALACLLGVSAFLFAGLTETEGWTMEENWIFSTFCCLLPIAGSGLVLMMAGIGIWYSRLRGS
jgi:hypothetical protein